MKTLTLEDEMPDNARLLWRAAEQHGWQVWATAATGTPIGDDGQPLHVTKRVPLFDPNTGAPLMTEGAKPRQRVEVIKTDRLQVIDSIAVRLCRDNIRLCAIWENGAFRTALRQSPFGRLNSREVTAVVTS